MQKINKLLVVIEPELMESLALKRAKQIAEKTKAALHLLICDKEDKHAALLSVLENALRAKALLPAANGPGMRASTRPLSGRSRLRIAAW